MIVICLECYLKNIFRNLFVKMFPRSDKIFPHNFRKREIYNLYRKALFIQDASMSFYKLGLVKFMSKWSNHNKVIKKIKMEKVD